MNYFKDAADRSKLDIGLPIYTYVALPYMFRYYFVTQI